MPVRKIIDRVACWFLTISAHFRAQKMKLPLSYTVFFPTSGLPCVVLFSASIFKVWQDFEFFLFILRAFLPSPLCPGPTFHKELACRESLVARLANNVTGYPLCTPRRLTSHALVSCPQREVRDECNDDSGFLSARLCSMITLNAPFLA